MLTVYHYLFITLLFMAPLEPAAALRANFSAIFSLSLQAAFYHTFLQHEPGWQPYELLKGTVTGVMDTFGVFVELCTAEPGGGGDACSFGLLLPGNVSHLPFDRVSDVFQKGDSIKASAQITYRLLGSHCALPLLAWLVAFD